MHDTRCDGARHATQDESGVRVSPTAWKNDVNRDCRCAAFHASRFLFAPYIAPGMTPDGSLDELLQKVWDGGRINEADALRLYWLPLEELGALADRRRQLLRAHAHEARGN